MDFDDGSLCYPGWKVKPPANHRGQEREVAERGAQRRKASLGRSTRKVRRDRLNGPDLSTDAEMAFRNS